MWKQYCGIQQGDPKKLVGMLMDLAGQNNPLLNLLVGPDTYDHITVYRAKEAEEFIPILLLPFLTNILLENAKKWYSKSNRKI